MTATTLVLSRHGQTVWHHENRYAGHSDVDLTPDGYNQAKLLADWAARVRPSVVACSPVRRAAETAAPTAHALGLEPLVVPDLREVSFGIAEGRTLAELEADDPAMVRRFRADPVLHHFPGAEAPAAAAERAATALVDLAASHSGTTVLVVAHNTLMRLALCRLLGIEIERYRHVFPRLDNGALTTVSIATPTEAGQPSITSLLSLNVPLTAVSASHPQ